MPARKEAVNARKPAKWEDPIVAEVRVVRDRIAARFDYDIGRIVDHFRALDAERNKGPQSPRRAMKAKTK